MRREKKAARCAAAQGRSAPVRVALIRSAMCGKLGRLFGKDFLIKRVSL